MDEITMKFKTLNTNQLIKPSMFSTTTFKSDLERAAVKVAARRILCQMLGRDQVSGK